MYHTRRGCISTYIDAVQMKMGALPFDESVDLVPLRQGLGCKIQASVIPYIYEVSL